MAELAVSTKTSSGYEDVIVGAMQFFGAEDWRATDQTARTVVLRGRPRIPWYMLLLMTLGFLAFVIPGVALYLLHIRKTYWFTSIIVSATPVKGGTEVVIRYGSPPRRPSRSGSWLAYRQPKPSRRQSSSNRPSQPDLMVCAASYSRGQSLSDWPSPPDLTVRATIWCDYIQR